jgi:hypothetical protein
MTYLSNLVPPVTVPGADGWTTAVLTIDSLRAEELLRNNEGNRKLSKASVARYAAAMRKGDWRTSPEPLIFSPSGRLMNGQTRLNAIKACGIPQKFLCVFGVDESVFSVLDRGRTRSLADAHQTDRRAAEVARLLTSVAYDAGFSGSAVLDSDFLSVLAVTQDIHAALTEGAASRPPVFGSAGFRAAAVARVLAGESPTFVFGMYRDLVNADVEALPSAGASAVRAVLTGRWRAMSGSEGSKLTMARGWSLLREDGQERTKIPVASPAPAMAEIRAAVRQAVTDSRHV